MKEKDLPFDHSRHLCYSKATGKVLRAYLAQRYPEPEAEQLWEQFQLTYSGFVTELTYLGGKDNYQSGGVYDSVALFALYEVLPEKPTLEEFERLSCRVFVPPRPIPLANLNKTWMLRLGHKLFMRVVRHAEQHRQDWPGNYRIEVHPFVPQEGLRYTFRFCPIAEFAKQHGYAHLMPALCNPDYPTLEKVRGGLIRTTTCGSGDFCDYLICGDQSPLLSRHPRIRDDAGYLRNR